MVEDIEDFYDRAVEIADIQRELEERPWGLKDFRFEDPFGFYIRVSEPHDIREEE